MIAGRIMHARSQGLDAILAELDRIPRWIDLEKGMGLQLLDVATFEILESMDSETDPDGIPWAPLSDSYLTWKAEIAPQAAMGVLYGIMKTWDQVAGIRDIWPDLAEMTYGITVEARVEAVKFSEGGIVTGTAQPPRPFYALTTATIIRADAIVGNAFDAAW